MGDVGRGRELGGEEALVTVPVGGDDLQEKIGFAGEHVGLADLGPGLRQRLEGLEIGLGLAAETHLSKHRDAETQRLGIDVGVIPPDKGGLLERTHAALAGRRRDAGALGQIDIGHAAIRLKIAQDPSIDLIKLDSAHPIRLDDGTATLRQDDDLRNAANVCGMVL